LGRPPVKSSKAVAAAQTKGRLEAETKFWDKQPLLKKLKRLAWKKIEEIDFIEFAAVIALMPIVRKVVIDPANGLTGLITGAWADVSTGSVFRDAWAAITGGEGEGQPAYGSGLTQNEIGAWAAAFAVSYILVKHGGEIIGFMVEGGKGLAGLGKALLAA
jgi:hypothetical protein